MARSWPEEPSIRRRVIKNAIGSRFPRALATWLLLCIASAHGQEPGPFDWPHLRGPNYGSISRETGLIAVWGPNGPPILWSRDLGEGYSGFVAVGARVFTQFQTRSGMFVVCLDADSGAEVWRARVDLPWQPGGAYPGPYATPTWFGGRLIYATPTGWVGCLDGETGASIWSLNVRKKFRGKGTEFGYAATPMVEAGRVILPVGGAGASAVALDVQTGATIWKAGDGPASYCPAYPITFQGQRLVVLFLQNTIAVLDPATGERLWEENLSRSYDEHSAWPLYAEPDLLIASPFRVGAQLFRLDARPGGITARTVWLKPAFSNDVCSSVLVGGHVFGFDLQQLQASPHRPSRGRFKCLDFPTGATRWETDKVGQATVLVADSKLVLLNETGDLILAQTNPAAYDELARVRIFDGGLCWTPPTLARGRLFLRNHSRAVCVFLGDPRSLDPNRPLEPPRAARTPIDWSRLLPREPDYPNDAPTIHELVHWFCWCLVAVFGPAAGAGGLVGLVAWRSGRSNARTWACSSVASVAFLLGLIGTTFFSSWTDRFILTWPASLYVAFRVTLGMGVWASARTFKARLLARIALLLFVALCFGYYRLCLTLGYLMAWGFLAGFLPAATSAVVAARARNIWLRGFADAAGFAIYFWCSGLLPSWKDNWFD